MNPAASELVVLVDTRDREIGVMEKLEAHRKGLLHRAFSVFIFNDQDEMLLQKRADSKYHSGGLWTNACCSHPRQGEPVELAASRRLKEELGLECELEKKFSFIYFVRLDNELSEHELDHVFIGYCNSTPVMNPEEVSDFRWEKPENIRSELVRHPEKFTEWFRLCFDELMNHHKKSK